jgi:hypothetical protein
MVAMAGERPEPFEIEWLGGPAEHHFRRARPGLDALPWGTLRPSEYPPSLVDAARRSWTELAINEYRAVTAFAEVVRAMALAKAPLDLVGMASDFLADECVHVELASRIATELGGGVGIEVDMRRFAPRPDDALAPFQRANEIVLQVGCISETFAAGIGAANRKVASHPLTRAVFDRILSDEARHRRLGALYFEWAADRLDPGERARLAGVATRALEELSVFWRYTPHPVVDGTTRDGWRVEDLHTLGWLEAALMVPQAREVVRRDVLEPLDALWILVAREDRERLLGPS